MKPSLAILLVLIAGCSSASEPVVPLSSGEYTFQHRFAEHPAMPSFQLKATISGKRIVLTNPKASGPFPAGVLAEGELMWHPASRQWIIGKEASDRTDPGTSHDPGELMSTSSPQSNNKMIGAGLAIGAGIGAGLGVVFGNIPIGVAVGVALGILVGFALSKRVH